MSDAHMPDTTIRVPRSMPYDADGDGDPNEVVLPYTWRDAEQACRRAVRWRVQCARQQGADTATLDCITFKSEQADLTIPNREGWMRIGWVIDPWVGGDLRIFWNPAANRVQVDRPPGRSKAGKPIVRQTTSLASSPDRTIPSVAIITVRDDTTVILKARPQYGVDRSVTAHHMSVVVPQPLDNEYFLWAMGVSAHTYNTMQLSADFWEWNVPERRDILIHEAHDLAARKAGKHR